MWLGTQTGLLRWDGYTMRRYTADSGQPRALPDSFIRAVHIDRAGILWVGTSSGGMARYDAASDDFTVFEASATGLSSGNVTGFADDGAGGLWIGTASGLDHLAPGGKFTQVSDRLSRPRSQLSRTLNEDARSDKKRAIRRSPFFFDYFSNFFIQAASWCGRRPS